MTLRTGSRDQFSAIGLGHCLAPDPRLRVEVSLEDVGLVLVHVDLVAHHQDEVGLGLLDEVRELLPDAVMLGLVARDDAEEQARGGARRGHGAKRPARTRDEASPAQDVVAVDPVGLQSGGNRNARAELELALGSHEVEPARSLNAELVHGGVVEDLDPDSSGRLVGVSDDGTQPESQSHAYFLPGFFDLSRSSALPIACRIATASAGEIDDRITSGRGPSTPSALPVLRSCRTLSL